MPDSLYSARAVEDARRIAYAAGYFRRDHGRWPELAELRDRDATLPRRDRWQRAFRLDVDGVGFTVVSAGADGQFGTCDDVASHPVSPNW